MAGRETDKLHKVPLRQRLYEIVEVSTPDDPAGRVYDLVSVILVLANLTATILLTFSEIATRYRGILVFVEVVTVGFFLIDYVLRILCAKYAWPALPERKAVFKYVFSLMGIIDLLSFLPYFLPAVFPEGAVAFRMIRVIRIFRLFRINAYYDSLNVIAEVLKSRRQQLLSSVFIILVLMVASSLCMYSIEHEAQPDVFKNAFSGMWWAVSTLLTVGYGDIYPITTLGKFVGIVLTFLGVGLVAIPTGIISAGFVEQYSEIKRRIEYAEEMDINFIKVHLEEPDAWIGKTIRKLGLPEGVVVAAIRRGDHTVVPSGDVVLENGDVVVVGAEPYQDDVHMELKEIVLGKYNDWNGVAIKDLNISRQTIIVLIRRGDEILIPKGNLVMQEGDRVILHSTVHVPQAVEVTTL